VAGTSVENRPGNGNVILSASGELAMLEVGKKMAACLVNGQIIYLTGCLGAGKTTLTGGIIRALGCSGAVKSPTYTLVEPYDLASAQVYHFDLYRLGDPEELEYIGIRDYVSGDAICIFEWPERGLGYIPLPDLVVTIEVENADSRRLTLVAKTQKGEQMLDRLKNSSE